MTAKQTGVASPENVQFVNVTKKQLEEELMLRPPWEEDDDPQVKLRGFRNVMSDKI